MLLLQYKHCSTLAAITHNAFTPVFVDKLYLFLSNGIVEVFFVLHKSGKEIPVRSLCNIALNAVDFYCVFCLLCLNVDWVLSILSLFKCTVSICLLKLCVNLAILCT